ncbi:hypothetical protein COCOBI_05-5220 [Coccomyxa sp. Obi]|nr:hypothetical protein COCOBI_05-5220 [Coccomyxa sp. Obi]
MDFSSIVATLLGADKESVEGGVVESLAIATLLSMAAPVVFTLLALLQRESVRSVAAARLLAARSSLAAQLRLLEEGRPLTFNANALADSIGVLRDSRDAESLRLADAALAAFQKAAVSSTKAKEADKDAHAHADHTIDIPASAMQQQEEHASLLGRSLYGPASGRVQGSGVAAAAEEGVSRTPSLAPPSRKSSVLSMRSSLASNPLLRSSTDFSSKISPLQRPMQPTTLEEPASMMGSPQSMHSFILPGESDAVDQSLQLHSSLDVPAGSNNEGSSNSSKHRHHKSRRHHRERPQKQEALAAMSGAYGMPIEEKPRKPPLRQDLDGDTDASDYL